MIVSIVIFRADFKSVIKLFFACFLLPLLNINTFCHIKNVTTLFVRNESLEQYSACSTIAKFQLLNMGLGTGFPTHIYILNEAYKKN